MTGQLRFLVDADVLISAHRQYYRFSFCPAYWRALLLHHDQKYLASIGPVRTELLRGKDQLANWVKDTVPRSFFVGVDDSSVIDAYGTLSSWVAGRRELSAEAKAKFASSADGWLVAYAQVNHFAVCTYEVSRPEAKSRVMIPDVANHCGVTCILPQDMLDQLGVRMVLAKKKGL